MAGKKSKANRPTRVKYRQFGRARNKDRNKGREMYRQQFFVERNRLVKEEKLSKGDARRRIRQLQIEGELDKNLSP